MEKLEKKINKVIFGTENPTRLTNREVIIIKHFVEFHASEVKDIAIAFGKEVEQLIITNHHITDHDELFTSFLKEYLK